MDKCTWTETEYGWETDCGNTFMIDEGKPSDNEMKYCCYCGKSLEEKLQGDG